LARKGGYFQTSDDEDGASGGTSSKGESKSKGKGESKGKTEVDRRPWGHTTLSGKILRYDGGKGQHKTKGESSEGHGKGGLSPVPLIRPHAVEGYNNGYTEGYGRGYSAGYLAGYNKGCYLL
jgi:hypothetical protein